MRELTDSTTAIALSEDLATAYPICRSAEVREWLAAKRLQYSRGGSKDPKMFNIKMYAYWLQLYCTHNEVESDADIEQLLTETGKQRNQRFVQFLMDIRLRPDLFARGKVPSDCTLTTVCAGIIRSFYKHHAAPITATVPEVAGMNVGDVTITREMLRDIIQTIPNPLTRMILKMMASTGLRPSDVLHTIQGARVERMPDGGHYFIRALTTQKRSVPVPYVFFTDELAHDLMRYYDIRDLRTLDLSQIWGSVKKCRKDVTARSMKNAARKAGIAGRVHPSLLRRYYQDQVLRAGVRRDFAEMAIGHKISTYLYESWKNNLPAYYAEWKKAEAALQIDGQITTGEIDTLKQENSDLKARLALIELRLAALQRLDLGCADPQPLRLKMD